MENIDLHKLRQDTIRQDFWDFLRRQLRKRKTWDTQDLIDRFTDEELNDGFDIEEIQEFLSE